MVYTQQTWTDLPATSPGSRAGRLNHIEAGIGSAGGGNGATHMFPDVLTVEEVSTAGVVTSNTTGSSATSISGGITAADMGAAAPYAKMAGKVGLIGTKRTSLIDIGSGFYGSNWKCASTGTSGSVAYPTVSYGIQFYCAGTRYVEILASGPVVPKIHWWVDDRKLTELPVTPSSWSAGATTNKYKIDFGATLSSTTPRLNRIMIWGGGFSKIFTEATGTVWEAPPPGPRVNYLGDSIGGYTTYTGNELGSWFPRFCNLAGIRDYWNGTIPGTGPDTVNGSYTDYKARASTDIAPSDADEIFVGSWYNDRAAGRTTSQVAADIGTICDTLNAMSTTPKIIVFSSYDPAGTNGTTYTDYDNAILPVCATKGAAYISLFTGKLQDYSGTLVVQDGPMLHTGNDGFFLDPDPIHPNDIGCRYMAHRMLWYYKKLAGALE